jgi:hypothetical protein
MNKNELNYKLNKEDLMVLFRYKENIKNSLKGIYKFNELNEEQQREWLIDKITDPFFIKNIFEKDIEDINDEKEKMKIQNIRKEIKDYLDELKHQKIGAQKRWVKERLENWEEERDYNITRNINNLAACLRDYVRSFRKDIIESAKGSSIKTEEKLLNRWQLYLLDVLNFWDFNNFENFNREVEKFRKRNKIDVGKFRTIRNKIQEVFINYQKKQIREQDEERLKKLKENYEFWKMYNKDGNKNEIEKVENFYKEEIKKLESKLSDENEIEYERQAFNSLAHAYAFFKYYSLSNLLDFIRFAIISQVINLLTAYTELETKTLRKFIQKLKFKNNIEFLNVADYFYIFKKCPKCYYQASLDDDLCPNPNCKHDLSVIQKDANENILQVERGVVWLNEYPLEKLYVLSLIKTENKLFPYEKIRSYKKFKKIPSVYGCILKDFIFYDDFNRDDWDLLKASRSINLKRGYLKDLPKIIDENSYNKENDFLKRATVFYVVNKKLGGDKEDNIRSGFAITQLLEIVKQTGKTLEEWQDYCIDKDGRINWYAVNEFLQRLGYSQLEADKYNVFIKKNIIF